MIQSPAQADLDHRFLTQNNKWPQQSLSGTLPSCPLRGFWWGKNKISLVSPAPPRPTPLLSPSALLSRFPSELPRESTESLEHPAWSLSSPEFQVPPLSPTKVPEEVCLSQQYPTPGTNFCLSYSLYSWYQTPYPKATWTEKCLFPLKAASGGAQRQEGMQKLSVERFSLQACSTCFPHTSRLAVL